MKDESFKTNFIRRQRNKINTSVYKKCIFIKQITKVLFFTLMSQDIIWKAMTSIIIM